MQACGCNCSRLLPRDVSLARMRRPMSVERYSLPYFAGTEVLLPPYALGQFACYVLTFIYEREDCVGRSKRCEHKRIKCHRALTYGQRRIVDHFL